MPKIFLVREDDHGIALAEDGSVVDMTFDLHPIYMRQALTSGFAQSRYEEHYPEGYTIVNLLESEDPFNEEPSYAEAFERNQSATAPLRDETDSSGEG